MVDVVGYCEGMTKKFTPPNKVDDVLYASIFILAGIGFALIILKIVLEVSS